MELGDGGIYLLGRGHDDTLNEAVPVPFHKVGQVAAVRKGGVLAYLGQDDHVESEPFGFMNGHDADNSSGGILPARQVFHAAYPFVQGCAAFVHLFRFIHPDGEAVPVEVSQLHPSQGHSFFQFRHDGGVSLALQHHVPAVPVHARPAVRTDEGMEGGMGEQSGDKGVPRRKKPPEEGQQGFPQRGVLPHGHVVAYFRRPAVGSQPFPDDQGLVSRADQNGDAHVAPQGV